MGKVLLFIFIGILMFSCKKNVDNQIPPFFYRFNIQKIVPTSLNLNNLHLKLEKTVKQDTLNGFNFECFIGKDSLNVLSKIDGFVFLRNNNLFWLQKNNTCTKIFNFNSKKGDSVFVNFKGNKYSIINEELIISRLYRTTFSKIRIKSLYKKTGEYPCPTDLVLIANLQNGIVGLYFSMILPKEYGGKEVIFNTQGDLLLSEYKYNNIELGNHF